MKHQKDSKQSSTAERFAALSRVGTALMSELDETRLLHMIASTARELTDATFAAFTLRPVDEMGQPLVPSEGNLFHLAAVVGVTKEQEELFRRMPLGGEGLLAPIFRHGVSVLVSDVLTFVHHSEDLPATGPHQQNPYDLARQAAFAYVHGGLPAENFALWVCPVDILSFAVSWELLYLIARRRYVAVCSWGTRNQVALRTKTRTY